ncbi:uncharacterized protein LOC118266242 isoform X1 [Spodoptera frugiperda]|uniref:Uncharacterized protein LOC118266242 isoform X1 n=1 Tax=Spodoptera frugiperda TaxID=7108 RepID=A0A9R0EI65_SPOFR|nr:uncharacterized protein LOC118266242 isoform X1 [Spodoptera frugiperda]
MAKLVRHHRLLGHQLRHVHHKLNASTINLDVEKKSFQAVLPEVIDCAITRPKIKELPEVQTWLKQLLEYTLVGGKLGRGLMVPMGYKGFEEPEHFSEETLHSARVIGWCIEMLHSTFLILDDVMDGGKVRHGKPSWHLHRSVSVYAVNDAMMIQQAMRDVLDVYFRNSPIYNDLISYFNEAIYRATMGEHLDLCSNYNKEIDNMEIFNVSRVDDIAINKSSFYTFKLPIFVALFLVNNGQNMATTELHQFCIELGRLMQVQDDYMDAYGCVTVTGKNGRDIQEGKSTWLAVTALQRCNSAQRSIFKEYYGSNDLEHVQRIKQLYDELNLPEVYEQYELKMYEGLMRRINEVPHAGGRNYLLAILNFCFKRVS